MKNTFLLLILVLCITCISLWGFWDKSAISVLAIVPRSLSYFLGIVTYLFVHKDVFHWFNNTIGILLLGVVVTALRKDKIVWLTLWGWIGSGLAIWLFGRKGSHIGASTLVYTYGGYLIACAFFYKEKYWVFPLALLLWNSALFYGWLPLQKTISWEGHLAGLLIGILGAYYFPPHHHEQQEDLEELPPEVWDYKRWL